jgi:hypothetical protein
VPGQGGELGDRLGPGRGVGPAATQAPLDRPHRDHPRGRPGLGLGGEAGVDLGVEATLAVGDPGRGQEGLPQPEGSVAAGRSGRGEGRHRVGGAPAGHHPRDHLLEQAALAIDQGDALGQRGRAAGHRAQQVLEGGHGVGGRAGAVALDLGGGGQAQARPRAHRRRRPGAVDRGGEGHPGRGQLAGGELGVAEEHPGRGPGLALGRLGGVATRGGDVADRERDLGQAPHRPRRRWARRRRARGAAPRARRPAGPSAQ